MRPGHSEPAAEASRSGTTRRFTVLTVTTAVLMAAASAPPPIYPLYRERWDSSVTMSTVVFAA
ncbi:hypothetical protein [Streptomyces sp. NPDC005507]|uniref:hypothetical protein n=1 Tax=Streptomyces sp. NPDC005507 TaxID=3154885 RepID=UPI0033B386B0